MLRRVFLLIFTIVALIGVSKLISQSQPKPTPRASNVVTTEMICGRDRKVPLTRYQRRMCEYLVQEFQDDPVMVEIAFCESSWQHQDERNGSVRINYNTDKNQTVDVGLYGINTFWNEELLRKFNLDPYQVRDNVRIAKHLRKKRGYQDWDSSKQCWGWVLARHA